MTRSVPASGAARRFEGQVALISGAGSGIGRSVAERFAAEGGRVTLLGRTREKLEAAASALPHGAALVVQGAHEDPAVARQGVAATLEAFGRIDLLFNNAGTYTPAPVAEGSANLWSETLAINLTGPFLLTREALPALRRQRSGCIINNASTLGLQPIAGAAAYCAAKAGLIMLTRATALEEAPHGIRVNAICPGVVDTPIHEGRLEPGADADARGRWIEDMGRLHPLGRIGTAGEIAALVLFLASHESSWTTGAVIPIDGGISLT
jgi:NAD(P)-dependent dehydrogenase (short-subunit alcohol dehydrogenase family)